MLPQSFCQRTIDMSIEELNELVLMDWREWKYGFTQFKDSDSWPFFDEMVEEELISPREEEA